MSYLLFGAFLVFYSWLFTSKPKASAPMRVTASAAKAMPKEAVLVIPLDEPVDELPANWDRDKNGKKLGGSALAARKRKYGIQ